MSWIMVKVQATVVFLIASITGVRLSLRVKRCGYIASAMTGKVNRDWFYKLASDLQDERVTAAVSLIEELSALKLPEQNSEWSYVLKRLISGLSSSRNSARLGFSLCLSEVVKIALDKRSSAPQELTTPEQYLELLSFDLSLDPTAGTNKKDLKGKDERGILFGKMFGLQALLNEPLFTSVFFENEKEVSPFLVRFAGEVAQLAVRKNWLREPCLYTLFQTVQRLLPALDDRTVESILLVLDKYQLTLTNEGLAIYLLLFYGDKKFRVSASLPLSNPGWKSNDPLAKGNLPQLARVLPDAPTLEAPGEDSLHLKSANWAPRLHFVWDILIPTLALAVSDCAIAAKKGSSSHKKKKKNGTEKIEFPEFFQMAVDETFFSERASSERKYLGFLIFIKAIILVAPQWVHSCYTRNFMRSLINQSSDPKRLLNRISRKTLDTIVESCEKNGSQKLTPTLQAILFGPQGSINFDKLTKSKTVTRLVAIKDLSADALDKLFIMLSSQLDEVSKHDRLHFQFVLDTILHAVRNHRLTISQDLFSHSLLDSIVDLAFFHGEDEELNNLARERLFSILSELTVQKDGRSWQYFTLKVILAKKAAGKELLNKLDENLRSVESEALRILQNVSSEERNPQSRGFECLLSNCLLQLYSGEGESVSLIEELCVIYREGLNGTNSLVSITEMLLSFLAQKRALLRRLSLIVWEQFITEVGEPELRILLDVLDARENKEGFVKLFENVDDYEEDEQGNEDGGDGTPGEGSMLNNENDEDSEEGSSDSNDLSDESEDEDDSKIAKIDKEATSALAKALNLPENIVNDKGEVDVQKLEGENSDDLDRANEQEEEEEEEEEESMDDEQMMELDEQLSQIFKRRKEALCSVSTGNERKLEVKESREDVISFKHRIVDMLEIYVKYVEKLVLKENTNDRESSVVKFASKNLLLFIQPTIKCLQTTLDKALANKITKLMKGKVYKIKISAFRDIVDPNYGFELLEATHEALLVSKPGQFATLYFSICSMASLFLGKVLVEGSNENTAETYEQMIDLYANTTKRWMARGKFGPNVFIDFQNWLFSRKKSVKD